MIIFLVSDFSFEAAYFWAYWWTVAGITSVFLGDLLLPNINSISQRFGLNFELGLSDTHTGTHTVKRLTLYCIVTVVQISNTVPSVYRSISEI